MSNNQLSNEVQSNLPAEISDLFNGYTGSDYTYFFMEYPTINILQSDKQFKHFSDGDDITTRLYGKYYVKSMNLATITDLRPTLSGTIIKEQRGAELIVDNKTVWTSNEEVWGDAKEEIEAEYGASQQKREWVSNIIKLLIKFDEPVTTSSGEELKYGVLKLKGQAKNQYKDQVKKMQSKLVQTSEEMKKYKIGVMALKTMKACFWHLDIGSALYKDPNNGMEYYIPTFKVDLLSFEEARKNIPDLEKAQSFDLISMRPTDVAPEDLDEIPTIDPNANEGELVDPEHDDELPF